MTSGRTTPVKNSTLVIEDLVEELQNMLINDHYLLSAHHDNIDHNHSLGRPTGALHAPRIGYDNYRLATCLKDSLTSSGLTPLVRL